MPEVVTVEHEQKGKVLLLRVAGRLDTLSAGSTEKTVLEFVKGDKPFVLLDFTEVKYLSSAGMRMLLTVFKRVRDSSGKLAVCSVDDGVMEVLKISGFDDVLDVFATEKEALNCF